jgi:hypothetical protein
MLFDLTTRTLTLDVKQCTRCGGRGDQPTHITCPRCNGTQRGPRGGRGGCGCYGGKVWDHENRVTCDNCHGNPDGASRETWTDAAPVEAVMSMSLIVIRQDRGGSWNESYLGLGCLWSSVDYGERWEREDDTPLLEEIVEQLRHDRTQACKIIASDYDRDAPTAQVARGLAILLHRNGYSVRVATTDNLARAQAEPEGHKALALGTAVYQAAGNGTLAAAGAYLTNRNLV